MKGYPHKQGFCVSPKRNLTKKKAWWQLGNSNNPKPRKQKDED